jgi:hypothetical protein
LRGYCRRLLQITVIYERVEVDGILDELVALQKGGTIDQDISPLRSNRVGEKLKQKVLFNHLKRNVVSFPIVENELSRIVWMIAQNFMRIKLGTEPADDDLRVFRCKSFGYKRLRVPH